MSVLDRIPHDDTAIVHRAQVRAAQERLSRIEEIRDVAILASKQLAQRTIAERLNTTQPRIHRIMRLLDLRYDGAVPEESPEEVILRAFVEVDTTNVETHRAALVKQLKGFPYTFGEGAPSGGNGYVPGSWDEVSAAYADGLLSKDEFDEVRSAVQS